MRADDLTVTVRDKTLARVGVIPPHLLEGTFVIPDTAVGDWKLRLPADHAMAALLRTPGYGIIVDGPDGTLFSGPMVKSTRDSDYRDEAGTVTIEGVTDEIILWDALAYPPEGFAYDTFTGEPWEIFDHFIDFNLGDLDRFPLGSFGNLLTTDFSAVDGTGGGGGGCPVTVTDTAYSTDDATTHTFSDLDFGAEHPDRTIFVGIVSRRDTALSYYMTAITVNGDAADEDSSFYMGSGSDARGIDMNHASVPTGTTGTVSVTFNRAATLCGVIVWRCVGSVGYEFTDSLGIETAIPAGGFAIAARYWESADPTSTWDNATPGAYVAIGDGRDAHMAGAQVCAGGDVTVDHTSGTASNDVGAVFVYSLS